MRHTSTTTLLLYFGWFLAYLMHIFPRLPTPFAHSDGVVVFTNGSTLTINAPSDTVNHYGENIFLDINAIDMSSYHEFGYTQNAQIKSGRIVNESINYTKSDSTQIKSQVENILVLNDSSEASDVASVEIAVKDSTAIPNLTFETSSTGNKICTIEIPAEDPSDTNTYAIWQTSVSEVKVVDNTVASNDVATADAVAVATVETYTVSSDDLNIGTGIENNPYLISSKEQLITLRVNINNSETNAQYAGKYYKLISDIDISNESILWLF